MRPSRDYSRWGEQDAILGFFGDGKPGRFLDLGAFDGVTESNTRALVEGVDLEVLPTLGPLLRATRLLCIEIVKPNEPFDPAYKAEMLRVAALLGFRRTVLETFDEAKRPRNVLLCL